MKEEALDRTVWRNHFARGFGPAVRQITDDDDVCGTVRNQTLSLKSRLIIHYSLIYRVTIKEIDTFNVVLKRNY